MEAQSTEESGAFDPTTLRTRADDRTRLTPEARSGLRELNQGSRRAGRVSPRRYNLTISHGHRFVWFRVAKVGTRTMITHFERSGVVVDVEHAMRIRYPVAAFEDYFKFGFVRHPLDRFVSAWQNKVVGFNYFGFEPDVLERMQSLEAFVEWTASKNLEDVSTVDQHLALQSRVIDLSQVDFLGRLESFAEDFAIVCRRLGLPEAIEVRRNQSSAPVRPEASAEVRERVAELYRLDFQVLGYDPAG